MIGPVRLTLTASPVIGSGSAICLGEDLSSVEGQRGAHDPGRGPEDPAVLLKDVFDDGALRHVGRTGYGSGMWPLIHHISGTGPRRAGLRHE
jgi:hypothetical protein